MDPPLGHCVNDSMKLRCLLDNLSRGETVLLHWYHYYMYLLCRKKLTYHVIMMDEISAILDFIMMTILLLKFKMNVDKM